MALSMESKRFQIESSDVDIAGGNTKSSNFKLSSTLGQLAAGQFQSDGYIVSSGFQYVHSIIPFTFSISDTNVDFGVLDANSPKLAKTDLTVSFGSAGQYQVTAAELGPLTSISGGEQIVDTVCNGGAHTCSEQKAKVWDANSAIGFGYNMTGDDVPVDFVNSKYFRPFPDLNAKESPALIMSNSNVQRSRQSRMNLKINVSPLQTAGSYRTILSFVATPSF